MTDRNQINNLVNELRTLSIERAQRTWAQRTRNERVSYADLNERLRRIVFDDRLLAGLEAEADGATDPLQHRELKLLRSLVLEGRITQHPTVQACHERLVEYHLTVRPTVDGIAVSEAQLQRTLSVNPDRDARRAAYEAYGQISAGAADGLRELILALNAQSRAYGFSDYYRFTLEQDDIDPEFLHDSMQAVKDASLPAAKEVVDAMASFLEADQLTPWDVPFARQLLLSDLNEFFPAADAVPSLRRTLADIGIQLDSLPVTLEAEPHDSKTYAAFCYAINPPDDVRVTANPLPGPGFYLRLYHEFGHALHAIYNRQDPWIFRREPGCFNEGMATILSSLIREPEWILRNTSVKPQQLQRLEFLRKLGAYDRRESLVRVSFELSAYHDANRDLDALWQERVQEYSPLSVDAAPAIWASDAAYATHPCTRHNFFLAAMITAQTVAALKRDHRSLFTPATGAFLIDRYYAPGRSLRWTDKIERATGAKLSADHLLATF